MTTKGFALTVAAAMVTATISNVAFADTELQGDSVYVPPTSYTVTSPTPACQGTIQDQNALLRAALGTLGTAASDAPDPVVATAGAIAQAAASLMPANNTQNYANCAVPCIHLLAGTKINSVNIVFFFENDNNRQRPFAANAFGRWDAGDGFVRADKINPVTMKDGSIMQCVLVRNWRTGDAFRMHARVDVHIN